MAHLERLPLTCFGLPSYTDCPLSLHFCVFAPAHPMIKISRSYSSDDSLLFCSDISSVFCVLLNMINSCWLSWYNITRTSPTKRLNSFMLLFQWFNPLQFCAGIVNLYDASGLTSDHLKAVDQLPRHRLTPSSFNLLATTIGVTVRLWANYANSAIKSVTNPSPTSSIATASHP